MSIGEGEVGEELEKRRGVSPKFKKRIVRSQDKKEKFAFMGHNVGFEKLQKKGPRILWTCSLGYWHVIWQACFLEQFGVLATFCTPACIWRRNHDSSSTENFQALGIHCLATGTLVGLATSRQQALAEEYLAVELVSKCYEGTCS